MKYFDDFNIAVKYLKWSEINKKKKITFPHHFKF